VDLLRARLKLSLKEKYQLAREPKGDDINLNIKAIDNILDILYIKFTHKYDRHL
jgi:hypothetical protein